MNGPCISTESTRSVTLGSSLVSIYLSLECFTVLSPTIADGKTWCLQITTTSLTVPYWLYAIVAHFALLSRLDGDCTQIFLVMDYFYFFFVLWMIPVWQPFMLVNVCINNESLKVAFWFHPISRVNRSVFKYLHCGYLSVSDSTFVIGWKAIKGSVGWAPDSYHAKHFRQLTPFPWKECFGERNNFFSSLVFCSALTKRYLDIPGVAIDYFSTPSSFALRWLSWWVQIFYITLPAWCDLESLFPFVFS